ncbi:MAG: glycosyltransferase family 2 protein [Bacteroidota bacterium]|nr:glycosyltransferase family 2 protein [Bacteroidota bacterium]
MIQLIVYFYNRAGMEKNHSAAQPFFSVIITTYNREELLKRALRSLVSQTEKDWEGIIIDDESADGTYNLIYPVIKSAGNLTYIRQDHGGETAAKNAGIKAAKGLFVTFLDSDDEYAPGHLEYRKSILKANPFVKFLYGGAKIIGNRFVPDRNNPAEKIDLKNCVIGGTFFIERNLLLSLNGFRQIYLGTDADLFDRVKKTGTEMIQTVHPSYIYHHETEDSITNRMMTEEAQGTESKE